MDRSIADSIRKLAGTYGADHIEYVYGTVDENSVNLNNTDIGAPTCSVTASQDVSYPNVTLQPVFCDGILKVPSDGSQVVISKNRNSNNWFVLLFSDIDAIYLQNQNAWLCLWNSNGEDSAYTQTSYGGLIKLLDPNDTSKGILAKMNAIEKDNNNLRQLMQTLLDTVVYEPGNGAPSAFQAAMKIAIENWLSPALTETVRTDIEDASITHGST